MTSNAQTPNLTDGEKKLLLSIICNTPGPIAVSLKPHLPAQNPLTPHLPKCDWAAVAAENGYKDAAIAKQRFQQIRRAKLNGAAGSSPAKAPVGGVDKRAPGHVNKRAEKPKKAAAPETRAKHPKGFWADGKLIRESVEESDHEEEDGDDEGDEEGNAREDTDEEEV